MVITQALVGQVVTHVLGLLLISRGSYCTACNQGRYQDQTTQRVVKVVQQAVW